MINIMYAVDPIKRIVKPMSGHAVTEQDHEASSLRFAFPDNIAGTGLDSTGTAVRVMYIRPDGGDPVAKTLTFYKHSGGYYLYDWDLQKSDLQKEGHLVFSLCILDISSGEVSEWHTTPCAVRVLSTIHTDDSDEADETITPTVAQRVAVLETMIQRVASGAPIVVSSMSAMTDTAQIYVLSTDGMWYYHNGSAWVAGGEYGAVATDTTLTRTGLPADSKAVGDKIIEIKRALRDSDAENIDLDITDPEGNVILRLADGGIETKNFNSADSLTEDDISHIPQMQESEDVDSDLDISDAFGNVIMRMSDGELETKKFRGYPYRTFSDTQTYTGTLPFTLTVNHHFSKGDHIVLHVERGAKPWAAGAYVNYYVGNKQILTEGRGDNDWIEYVVAEDVDTVSAVYTGTVSTAEMTSGVTFTFEVSLLGDIPIVPTVVTVKQDGSGDFTTLRGALDSIGIKANHVLNPYRIEIYPGTYDVIADYTDDEIADADYSLWRFVGPVLYNGMYLVGMGNNPEETVLTASLDPERWSNSIRGVISPLNCQGSCGFENITVKAYNLRYCVHDDYTQPLIHRNKRVIKNVILRGYGVSYTPCTTYGAGTRYSTGDYYFENCDFGENAGLHTSDYLLEPTKVHLINCTGHGFRIGDNVQDNAQGSEAGRESEYRFDNCDFLWINQRMVGSVPHVIVRGSGGSSPLYQFDAQTLYATGDVVIVPNSGKPAQYSGTGTVLEWYSNNEHGPRFRPAASYDTARGVVVWEDSEDTYIQTKGYVRTDRTGITTFALGDYVGMSNGVVAVVPNADTAFGRIAYIDNTGAGYIELDWKR